MTTERTPDWRKIAHDLAYMIHFLKDDPNSIRTWEKVFKHLQEYKEACDMERPPVPKTEERRRIYMEKIKKESNWHVNKDNYPW